jgi:hypothetical protein
MASVTRNASVPTTVSAVVYDINGVEIRVTGAGPWTLTTAQAELLKACRHSTSNDVQIPLIGTIT